MACFLCWNKKKRRKSQRSPEARQAQLDRTMFCLLLAEGKFSCAAKKRKKAKKKKKANAVDEASWVHILRASLGDAF